jgi:uncharacterized membrane protein YkoI
MRSVFALICLMPLMAAAPAWADEDDDDHDEAREAVEHGKVVPLAQVLARPELKGLGELVRVQIDRSDGRWTYRLRFVDEGGHMKDRAIDATRGPEPHGRR